MNGRSKFFALNVRENAMNGQIQSIWFRFDELIKNAETPEARMIAETAKLQAELLNLRLGPIEHLLGRALKDNRLPAMADA
jgi:hypothetical protein